MKNRLLIIGHRRFESTASHMQSLRDRGLTYYKSGKYQKALEDFDSALARDPGNAEIYRVRGDTNLRLKNPDRALADYSKSLELNPKDAVAYNNRGLVYHELNELDKALEEYSHALAINPGMAIFYENRAIIFLAKGMNDKAAEDYSQALKLTTDEARKSELLEKLSVISPKSSTGASDPTKQLPELSGPGFSLSRPEMMRIRREPEPPGLVGPLSDLLVFFEIARRILAEFSI